MSSEHCPCGELLLFSARERGDGLCGPCSRAARGAPTLGDLARRVAAIGGTPDALPIGQAFALTGRWRVYFNRHGAADRPWCVAPDAGGFEIAVSSVGISTVAGTVYRPKSAPDDEDGRPSAWIAVDGYLTIHMSGHASIGVP